MFAICPSVEFFIGLAVVDEVIHIRVEFDIPGSIAPSISSEFVPIARSTLIGGRDDMDILSRIGRIPVECKESKLRIVVISSEGVSYRVTVIILVPVRGRSAGSSTGREPDLIVIGAGRSGSLRREVRTDDIERKCDEYPSKKEYSDAEKYFVSISRASLHKSYFFMNNAVIVSHSSRGSNFILIKYASRIYLWIYSS